MTDQSPVLPAHVAIIPDGNRRWAAARDKSPLDGHRAGVKAFREIAQYAAKRGVGCLSIWGMSLDNFTKRKMTEVTGLLNIFRQEFKELAQTPYIHEQQIKIQVFGRWRERFPLPVRQEVERAMAKTSGYSGRYLNFFLAYNGTDEMISTIQSIAERRDIEPRMIDAALIKSHLLTHMLPPVDLMIRTGGEPHLSAGFMMWDMADAQLFFTKAHWPDFDTAALEEALTDYAQRQRRFGI